MSPPQSKPVSAERPWSGEPRNEAGSFDVAVVGGGVIGLAVAWRAAQRGLKVVVLERDVPGAGATGVAAGMLAPTSEAEFAGRELLALGRDSLARYPGFVAELAEASGEDPGYLACGTLVVARDRDEAEELDRELAFRLELALPFERLRPSAARRLEPALAPRVRLAAHAPEDHAVDPRRLAAALAVAVRRAGAVLRPGCEVTAIATERDPGERVSGVVLAGGELVAAGRVLVAAGAWSSALAGLPPAARVPVRPVKGQIMRLRDPAGPGLLTRCVRMAGSYVVPRGDGRYVLGATMEERGFETTVTAGGLFELLRDASEVVPGLLELEVEEVSAGLRPGTPDNAPAIGPGALAGLFWATGHHRNGILLAPVTADAAAAALAGEPLPPELAPFAPARFGAGAAGATPVRRRLAGSPA